MSTFHEHGDSSRSAGGRSNEAIGVRHRCSVNHRGRWRELASRSGDGLQISLVWSKSADRVKVTVFDERLREPFDIHIDRADALSAFYHPFAYTAAARRASARDGERASLFLRQQV
jgi:hypothetical protein